MTERPFPFTPEPQVPELLVANDNSLWIIFGKTLQGDMVLDKLVTMWQSKTSKPIRQHQVLRGGVDGP